MQDFEEIIRRGIHGMPQEQLKEIAEFVFFVRQKLQNPIGFQESMFHDMLSNELDSLNENECRHLESEFENYREQYPK